MLDKTSKRVHAPGSEEGENHLDEVLLVVVQLLPVLHAQRNRLFEKDSSSRAANLDVLRQVDLLCCPEARFMLLVLHRTRHAMSQQERTDWQRGKQGSECNNKVRSSSPSATCC